MLWVISERAVSLKAATETVDIRRNAIYVRMHPIVAEGQVQQAVTRYATPAQLLP